MMYNHIDKSIESEATNCPAICIDTKSRKNFIVIKLLCYHLPANYAVDVANILFIYRHNRLGEGVVNDVVKATSTDVLAEVMEGAM
ncbi:hypothetical protein SK128_026572 [Halocaridina rubra]|uniref:Uncharacterized protein n=1 Tax=Halocaridina rubra TaxID=373956 RepID=A0AAN8ZYT5_HALRR